MSVSLKQSEQREKSAQDRASESRWMDGVALVRECRGAVRAAHGSALLSEDERGALAQVLAERVTRKHLQARRGSAAQVLAWMDRAERLPLWAEQREQVERGSVGREYLRQRAEELLRDSREWRDVAGTWAARERRDRERSGPGITLESWEAQSASESGRVTLDGAIARESAARPVAERAPLPQASADLCEAWADSLAMLTEGQRRDVGSALLADLAGIPADTIALREGRTLRAAIASASRGRAVLATVYPTARELVEAGRRIAERDGLLERDSASDRPQLTDSESDALAQVDAAKRVERRLASMYRTASMRGPERGSAAQVIAYMDRMAERFANVVKRPTPSAKYVPAPRILRAALPPRTWAAVDSDREQALESLAQRAAQRAERKLTERADYRALMDAVAAQRTAVVTAD